MRGPGRLALRSALCPGLEKMAVPLVRGDARWPERSQPSCCRCGRPRRSTTQESTASRFHNNWSYLVALRRTSTQFWSTNAATPKVRGSASIESLDRGFGPRVPKDRLCPLGVPNEAMAHRGPDRRMVPAFIARTDTASRSRRTSTFPSAHPQSRAPSAPSCSHPAAGRRRRKSFHDTGVDAGCQNRSHRRASRRSSFLDIPFHRRTFKRAICPIIRPSVNSWAPVSPSPTALPRATRPRRTTTPSAGSITPRRRCCACPTLSRPKDRRWARRRARHGSATSWSQRADSPSTWRRSPRCAPGSTASPPSPATSPSPTDPLAVTPGASGYTSPRSPSRSWPESKPRGTFPRCPPNRCAGRCRWRSRP